MYSKINKITLFLFLIVGAEVRAQFHEQGAYKVDYDTNYIRDFRHRFSFALTTDYKSSDFFLFREDDPNLRYTTNLPRPTFGVMVTYRWLNFTASIPLFRWSKIDENYSETEGFSLALGVTGRKWYFRNFFEGHKGFQLKNPENVDPLYYDYATINPDYQNLKQRTYLATLYYGLNGKKYSQRNILWQSETQKKSAGSFLVGINGGYKWMDSDKSIVPNHFVKDSIAPDDVLKLNYLNLGLAFGYAHTFVLPLNFNFSTILVPALNYANGRLYMRDGTSEGFSSDIGANAEFRMQLTYNNVNFYVGASYTTYAISNVFGSTGSFGTLHNLLRLNIGYHFHMRPLKSLEKLHLSN